MPRYSDERKEAVLRKMLPPHNRPLGELAAEEGISEATLYNWRRAARDQGRLLPDATRSLSSYQDPSASIPLRVIEAELSLAEAYDKVELSG